MAREYDITKTAGQCHSCQAPLAPGTDYLATVREDAQGLRREDYCLACAEKGRGAGVEQGPGAEGVLAEWRARVPLKPPKKKLFVDDEVLIQFFRRLADSAEPARVTFRFVLALVLMRKKLLAYDKAGKTPDGRDAWNVHFRGTQEPAVVIDPHMDEAAIAQASQQLTEVLQGEL